MLVTLYCLGMRQPFEGWVSFVRVRDFVDRSLMPQNTDPRNHTKSHEKNERRATGKEIPGLFLIGSASKVHCFYHLDLASARWPRGGAPIGNRFKRFPLNFDLRYTWLKPGVNETRDELHLELT
jgi:hypothetical protein